VKTSTRPNTISAPRPYRALFETASEKYGWLNRIVTVATGHRLPDGPVYQVFEVP
jgi:hypothetical protein